MSLKLAVLGDPIDHSRSPGLHQSLARSAGIDLEYTKIRCTVEELAETVNRLREEGFTGFNCTMPLKTAMAGLADSLTVQAATLRSVNTTVIRGGKLEGSTTDGDGMVRAIAGVCPDLSGKRVLLLGAGGAGRSIGLALHLRGCRELVVLNRSLEGAESLRALLGDEKVIAGALNHETLRQCAASSDVIVNSTSLGMEGFEEFADFGFLDAMPSGGAVVDAVYSPLRTRLLAEAEGRGIAALGGLWMLVYQGVLAFETWTETTVSDEAARRAYEDISAKVQ